MSRSCCAVTKDTRGSDPIRRSVAAPAGALGVGSVGVRRVAIGIGLAILGIGCALVFPLFAVLVSVIAIGCLWEFDKLALRKGTPVELAVAAPAVLAYIALTAFGVVHRFESL